MVKHVLLASVAFCFAGTAAAFPTPPDIIDRGFVTPLYKTDSSANVTIDPAVTPPPAYAYELTNIPIPSNTNRIVTTAAQGPGSPYCTIIADGGTCSEYKFRTTVDPNVILPDDPLRNWGQSGLSHLHYFGGSSSTNAFSTFKSLRQHAIDSTAGGTDANGTGYWRPPYVLINPFSDGKNFALKDDFWTVYYVGDPGKKLARYAVGMGFVWGFDMDSSSPTTQYAWLQTLLNTYNAAYNAGGGGGTRYTLTSGGRYGNQVAYDCLGATPVEVNVLKNPDGSDPYAGTCGAGQQFYAKIDGPKCWDGKNLLQVTGGGYKHMIPSVFDSLYSAWVCPYNYYQVPNVRIEFTTSQNGWTDRQRWDLASDIAYRAAKGLTTAQLPPGTTFHTDWRYGWDKNIFNQALENCAGADGVQGHECNSSYFSSTQALDQTNGAGGRSPQINFSAGAHVLETDPGLQLIAPSWSGALSGMQMHN